MNLFKKKPLYPTGLRITVTAGMGQSIYEARQRAETLAKTTGCEIYVGNRDIVVKYKHDGTVESFDTHGDNWRKIDY